MTPPTLHRGDRGPDVARWQRALVALGYELHVDSDFGPATETATKRAQALAGLDADGAVGPATWALEPQPAPAGAPVASDEQAIRAAAVERALAVVGLGYALPTRSAYLDLLAPCPADRASPKVCAALGQMSSCALTVRGLWARAGVRHPILAAPYRTGRAVSDVVEIAREASALHGPERKPEPGDVVIIGGPEHVLTVTAWSVGTVVTTVVSVDGGQRDSAGLEVIAARERRYHTLAGRPHLAGRPVLYVVDVVTLMRRWAG